MAVPQYFKAAVVHEPKAQNVISNRSLAPLGPGEVAIKITVTAINPVDWKMRDYNKFISEYPAVLGSDAAGSVAAVGPDVTGFAVGDRVFFQGIIGKHGSSTFNSTARCQRPSSRKHQTTSVMITRLVSVSP